MPTIRQDTLMEAYRQLMSVYWLPPENAVPSVLRSACLATAVDIKVAIGSIDVVIDGTKPIPL